MTKEEIIEMAKQAGFERLGHDDCDLVCYPEELEDFAKLVAKHTLLNIDPSSFMSFQEGVEVGRLAEREACALIADKSHRIFRDTKDAHDRNSPNSEPFNPNFFGFSVNAIEESLRITLAIRARGQE